MNVFGLGPGELILVLTLALIVFGPKKLPEIGAGLGKAIGQFRKATNDLTQEITREMQSDGLKELASLKDLPRDLSSAANTIFEASTRPEPKTTETTPATPVPQPVEPQAVESQQPAVAATESPAAAIEPTPVVAEPAPIVPAEPAPQLSAAPRRLRIREAVDSPTPAPEVGPGH
jgi:TatA/E family protein of Tat protein translocase